MGFRTSLLTGQLHDSVLSPPDLLHKAILVLAPLEKGQEVADDLSYHLYCLCGDLLEELRALSECGDQLLGREWVLVMLKPSLLVLLKP